MEQQQEVQVEEGVNLIGIFKLLLSKIKLLILVVLIGGVLGASLAVWQTVDINHYGTKVEFYINPETAKDGTEANNSQYGVYGAYGRHVMDNMIKLLNSESFTEQMMLNGRALPDKTDSENFPGVAENEELCTEIVAAEEWLEKFNAAKESLEQLVEERADNAKKLKKEREELDRQWAGLYNIKKVNSSSFNEQEYTTTISVIDAEHDDYQKVKATQEVYKLWSETRDAVDQQDDEIELQQEAILPLQEETERLVEVALETWRETEEYQEALEKHNEAVSFTYLQGEEVVDNTNNFARSFIYVEIFVLNDRGFAEKVFETVKTVVPEYVETNMTVPAGYVGTNCKRITRMDGIRLTNPGYTTNQAVKYGLLAGFAGLIIACIVVIFIDKMDKRLRDTSIITKQFDIPLLGTIPSIEEIKKDANVENTNKKEGE